MLALAASLLVGCKPVDNDDLPTDALLVDGDNDGFTPEDGDCNDSDPSINPSQPERCNEVDDNCDTHVNEGFDQDQDGFLVCGSPDQPPDCDDTNFDVRPGAPEVCDGLDNNCDQDVDEGFDQDNDGVVSCEVDGQDADCDDDDDERSPDLSERCDSKDNDCDGDVDEGFDDDNDGYTVCGDDKDCDDDDKDINPGEREACNGDDDNCDGDVDEGFDEDGDGYFQCESQGKDEDCDDGDDAIKPGAREDCDGADNDCDGATDEGFDEDKDGYYTCESQGKDADCDDGNASVHPGATELCDGKDQDCDGSRDEGLGEDDDDDGFLVCDFGGDEDCDDTKEDVFPGATETCDAEDDDCDGDVDEDFDGDSDGYTVCGVLGQDVDCDDDDVAINPGAAELCNDADEDCDLLVDEDYDLDEDGYSTCGSFGRERDCDDGRAGAFPGASEVCNGDDDDCDGEEDEDFDQDQDGFTTCGLTGSGADCDDEEGAAYPGNTSEPCDGIDNNCSGGGGDLYVHADTSVSADHRTIAAAISAAGAGCVVVVGDGTWAEKIDFNGKAITLKSENGPSTTTLGKPAESGSIVYFLRGEGRGSVLEGFNLTGGTGDSSLFGAPAGGAVYIAEGAGPTLRGNTFYQNEAQFGGAIVCDSCSGPLIEGNYFRENWAKKITIYNGFGGAFYGELCDGVEFQGNIWFGNHADQNAGAIQFDECEGTIDGDVFDTNYASGFTGSGRGGAISFETGTLEIRNSLFEGNKARVAGALYSADGILSVGDSSFLTNSTTYTDSGNSTGDGGAIYLSATLFVGRRLLIDGNVATEDLDRDDNGGFGGGIFSSDTVQGSLENCVISNNAAAGKSGGGAYLWGEWDVSNSLIYSNDAAFGGGFYVDTLTAESSLINNTFVDNAATGNGGTMYINSSSAPIYNNIIAYTLAKTAIYYVNDGLAWSSAVMQYNDLFSNPAGNFAGNMTEPVGNNGNVAVDPLFTSYVGGDFSLQGTSPVLDGGNPATQYNDVDGSRNQIGMLGGPGGDWDPDSVGFPLD